MRVNKRKSVFIGFEEIGGNLTRIASEFKKQGYDCYCLILGKYKQGADIELRQNKIVFDLYSFYYQKYLDSKNILRKGFYALFCGLWSVLSLLYAILKYDNFIFDFNTSFFSKLPLINKSYQLAYFDLKILHFLNKNMIMWYMGSDSRPPYINGRFKNKDILEVARTTQKVYLAVQMIEKYCNYTIDNPAQAHFHKYKFIMFQAVGIPISEQYIKIKAQGIQDTSAIRIVHAPSAPEIKGTEYIRSIIKRLRSMGYKIEYVEMINKTHKEVMEELSIADIVIDEIFADTPLGGLGIEAAINKVPTVTSGYFAVYAKEILGRFMPPSCYCIPEKLENELKELIDNKEKRICLGEKAFEFATRSWSTERVVQNFIEILNNNVPDEWYYDPYACEYPYGAGISRVELQRLVKEFVKKNGFKALYIGDKPKLLHKYLQLCEK